MRRRAPNEARNQILGSIPVLALAGAIATAASLAPKVLEGSSPVMVFAAMTVSRRWSFRPARLDGQPVPSTYSAQLPLPRQNCSG